MAIILEKNKQDITSVIATKTKVLSHPLSQSIGLMFHFQQKKAFLFTFPHPVRHTIHMCFVFFPLDVIFIDSNNTIIELKENLKPFTFYRPKNPYSAFIEVPAKTIKKHSISIDDSIRITEE
jgi:uncharacterized membrane protein (UPF0127 family)